MGDDPGFCGRALSAIMAHVLMRTGQREIWTHRIRKAHIRTSTATDWETLHSWL